MTRPQHRLSVTLPTSFALVFCAATAATAAAAAIACGGGANPPPAEAPRPRATSAPSRPLAGLAAQRVVVAPALVVREGDPAGWAARIPRLREFLRVLDDEIAAALAERGLGQAWVFPDQLWRGHSRNPSLGVDPYRLATQPLRGTRLAVGDRIAEPLASQLRSLVAVHDGRLVLLPIEVFFEIDRTGSSGRTALRLTLIDARRAQIQWVGEVRADRPATEPDRAQLTAVATRLANLVTAP